MLDCGPRECVCGVCMCAGVGTDLNLCVCALCPRVSPWERLGCAVLCGSGECVWGSLSGVDVSVSVPVGCVARNTASVGRSWAVVECGREPRVCVHV